MTIYAKRGSKGGVVKKIQEKINDFYGDVLKPDGSTGKMLNPDSDFGSLTHKAVKQYQSEQGLIPDGIVGDFCNAMLNEEKFGFSLTRPRIVRQGVSQRCWAATTESMLHAMPGRPNQTMQEVLDAGTAAGHVSARGGLRVKGGEHWWMKTFRLKVRSEKAHHFYAEKAAARLKRHKTPLPVGLRASTGGEGHISLMYGAETDGGELYVWVMEPLSGSYFKLEIAKVQVISGDAKTWMPR